MKNILILLVALVIFNTIYAQEVGSRINQKGTGGNIYPGVIKRIKGDKYLIKYDNFSFTSWITINDFTLADPTPPKTTTIATADKKDEAPGKKYYDEGMEAADHYQTGKAYRLLEKASDMGYIPADSKLATMYANGYGNKGSSKDVIKHTIKAAEGGDTTCISMLAYYYETGRFADESIPEAIKWYQKAADMADENATIALAKIYFSNVEERNFDKARPLFKVIADKTSIKGTDRWYEAKAGYLILTNTRAEIFKMADTIVSQALVGNIYKLLSKNGDGEASYKYARMQTNLNREKEYYGIAIQQGYYVPQADFDRMDAQFREANERARIANQKTYVPMDFSKSKTSTSSPNTPTKTDPYESMHNSQQKAEKAVDDKYKTYKHQ